MNTKSGFHKAQRVQIIKNWRTGQIDGRYGVINSIRRAYHGSNVDVSTAIEIEVLTDDGKYHNTFKSYLKDANSDPECIICSAELSESELLTGAIVCSACKSEREVTSYEYRSTVYCEAQE